VAGGPSQLLGVTKRKKGGGNGEERKLLREGERISLSPTQKEEGDLMSPERSLKSEFSLADGREMGKGVLATTKEGPGVRAKKKKKVTCGGEDLFARGPRPW